MRKALAAGWVTYWVLFIGMVVLNNAGLIHYESFKGSGWLLAIIITWISMGVTVYAYKKE